MRFATEISDRAYIIESGRVRYEGTMTDLEKQPEIKRNTDDMTKHADRHWRRGHED